MHCVNLGLLYTANGSSLLYTWLHVFAQRLIFFECCVVTSSCSFPSKYLHMKEHRSISKEHIDRAWLLWRSDPVPEGAACGSVGRLPRMVQREQSSCWAGPLYHRTCPLFPFGQNILKQYAHSTFLPCWLIFLLL